MIVRLMRERFIVVEQHKHGLIAGELARHMSFTPVPLNSVLYAIAQHDRGWQKLDEEMKWDEKKQMPYSFATYPQTPKIAAYTNGIAEVESVDAYAACLCSLFYATFFKEKSDQEAIQFRDREQERQLHLMTHMPKKDRDQLKTNLELLQFCDDLSLSLCFNPFGEAEHPWFKNGIMFQGETYNWKWIDANHLVLTPSCFGSLFSVCIPYRIVNQKRQIVETGMKRLYIE
ncbi:DUF3891 family protein [Hazenella sp. IB182357]|uniref:DUF3891 family protein n=1 Tax=Polycladospora coralii TaxID=2771432 RepID=A0A926RSW3_9BACL|nr:DUF3891 family protein [Polycladospora coralii]MBD1370828.1 DUF3891 family protein [Polycladospora coralii]